MLQLSYFPAVWKLAKIIALPKPGKDPKLLNSYRPISLLSSLSKVVERVVLNRLNKFIRTNDILIPEQFGFRKGHSTIKQLARVKRFIINNFSCKKHTGMLLLDIEKAFDTVWHTGLLFKLIKHKFPKYLVLFIKSYISNRTFKVTVRDRKSQSRRIEAGVPQGSVLGPVLFNLYINDLPRTTNTEVALFADDTAIFTSSWRTDTIVNRLQTAATKVNKYCQKWRIKLNPAKSETIMFTKRRPAGYSNVTLNGNQIEWSSHVRYLGVILDKRLTFTKHIKHLCDRAYAALFQLFPLFNPKSKLSSENKMLIYKSAIRPILTYGSPVWKQMCKTNYRKLQIIQNKSLRIISGLPRYTPIVSLHEFLNICYLNEYIEQLNSSYYKSCSVSESTLINTLT